MAEVEEPRLNTLAERIAALNQQKNFKAPAPGAGKRPPPPPPIAYRPPSPTTPARSGSDSAVPSPSLPPRPTRRPTEQAPALPRRCTAAADGDEEVASGRKRLAPAPVTGSTQPQTSPALPPRRPSSQTTRRGSNASDVSQISTLSNPSLGQYRSAKRNGSDVQQSTRKLPPSFDQAKLPPLPPTRRERELIGEKEAAARLPLTTAKSAPLISRIAEPPRPLLPPRLPSRPARSPAVHGADEATPVLPTRRLPPPSSASALQSGFGGSSPTVNGDAPPPIPLTSRPNARQIDAAAAARPAKPARPGSAPVAPNCLVCRDYSGPDAVAAQHPTHTVPRHDPVEHLARVLCEPFPSLTDKARAIFTWCHHNMAYDVANFFAGTIPRGQGVAEMIFSGKAVCEGYAKVYEAIATRAGLECVLVTGHGKGFSHKPVAAGQPLPPEHRTGHAWNAVRIDGGAWKLVDACWGAGHLGPGNSYTQHFAPAMFWLPNEVFGLRHLPADARHLYRADGRLVGWDEYILGPAHGEQAELFGAAALEGLSEANFSPQGRKIAVRSGEVVRFQFAKVCEHWRPERNGSGPQMLFLLAIHGLDGRRDDHVPLDSDGFWFWADVAARDLGAPGQAVSLYGLQTLENRSARGVTKEEFLQKKGRCAMSFVGIAKWDLV